MEWTEWLRNYHRDHMEEYLREEMQECGLPGEIHKEKAFMGEKEVDRYWVEIADGILLEGICFEDIQKLCESSGRKSGSVVSEGSSTISVPCYDEYKTE